MAPVLQPPRLALVRHRSDILLIVWIVMIMTLVFTRARPLFAKMALTRTVTAVMKFARLVLTWTAMGTGFVRIVAQLIPALLTGMIVMTV